MIDKLIRTIRFQQHSPDCAVHGEILPRDPRAMDDDEFRGPPGPCDCWRAAFFHEADALQAEIKQLKATIAVLEADCEDGTCRACVKCHDARERERDEAVSAAAVQNKACAEEMLARQHMQVNWDTMVASIKQHHEAQLDAEADNRRLKREVEAWRAFESHSQDALCPLCDDYGLCPTFSKRK